MTLQAVLGIPVVLYSAASMASIGLELSLREAMKSLRSSRLVLLPLVVCAAIKIYASPVADKLFPVVKRLAVLTRIFLRDEHGRRPVCGGTEKFQTDLQTGATMSCSTSTSMGITARGWVRVTRRNGREWWPG